VREKRKGETYLLYSSKNQAISVPPVFMSGAGMSVFGPMTPRRLWTSFLVSFSSSFWLRVDGSTVTPPLAPPKGRFMTAVFQVIKEARERTWGEREGSVQCRERDRERWKVLTSSRSHWGWKRIPPLYGPRALSCCTLYASKDAISLLSFKMVRVQDTSLLGVMRRVSNLAGRLSSLSAC